MGRHNSSQSGKLIAALISDLAPLSAEVNEETGDVCFIVEGANGDLTIQIARDDFAKVVAKWQGIGPIRTQDDKKN